MQRSNHTETIPRVEETTPHRIFPVIADRANRRLLLEWLEDRAGYEPVEPTSAIETAEFDVCIVDQQGFLSNSGALKARKESEAPILLPYLLLLPETDVELIETDRGKFVDNAVSSTIDEFVSLPIKQVELEWRMKALLRLRNQSVTLTRKREELKGLNQRLRAVIDAAPNAIIVVDVDGTVTQWNPAAERIFGWSKEEVLDEMIPILPDGKRPEFDTWVEKNFAGDVIRGEQTTRQTKDGATIDVRVSTSPVRDATGEITGSMAIIEDITDELGRKRELQESQRRYRLLADNFPDGFVAVFDTDLRYLLVGPDNLSVSGLGADEMEGRTIFELFPTWVTDELADHYRAGLDGEQRSFEMEFNDHVFDLNVVPLQEDDPAGSAKAMVVARDITEAVSREQKLREIDESRRLALEASDAGIWEWAPDSGTMDWHETCERLFGLEPDTFEGTFDAYLDRIHPDDRDPVRDALTRSVDRHEPFELTYRIVRDDGIERWIDGRGRLIVTDTGPTTMVGVNVDITERKEWQKQLAVVGRVLRHDIRNEMNIITGWAETIQQATESPHADYAANILDHAYSLIETAEKERSITEILTSEPQRTSVDLDSTIAGVVATIRNRYPTAQIAAESASNLAVFSTVHIGRAIEELIENAIVHSDTKEPQVDLSIRKHEETIEVSVTDDGPGIPALERTVLRTGESIEPLNHRSGLGLWLVYWIVRRSNGSLRFDEADPRGNVVTIELERSRSGDGSP